jgi:hypothetical protein
MTLRFELVHRFMNIPYFNGPGGVTGPNGYQTNPATSYNPNSYIPASGSFTPDLVNSESRFIIALITRF